MKISCMITVANDAARLVTCLEHVRPHVDEIVIVVQESTDDTLRIAKGSGAVVLEDKNYGHPAPSRQKGVSACAGEWVLNLDADERLSYVGTTLLRALCAHPTIGLYGLRRLTTVDGHTIEDAAHNRLFRKAAVLCPSELHSDFQPRPGYRTRVVADDVMIEHYKTTAEQDDDNKRYANILGGK